MRFSSIFQLPAVPLLPALPAEGASAPAVEVETAPLAVPELPDDLDAALDALEPPQLQGYLSTSAFCVECERALVKATPNGTECVLARLFLLPDLDLADALAHCRTRRGGDLFSCDSRSVYVFLYGCWQHDVAATLERLFTLPIPELFIGHVEHTDAVAIRRELANLGERARTLRVPDFSQIVASAELRTTRRDAAAEPLTVRLEAAGRAGAKLAPYDSGDARG